MEAEGNINQPARIMNFEPLSDRVLIRPDEADDMVGGVYIPDNAREKPQRGTVVAVGHGRTENGEIVPPRLKAGDAVVYGKYSGTEIEIGGETLVIMREADVLGRFRTSPARFTSFDGATSAAASDTYARF